MYAVTGVLGPPAFAGDAWCIFAIVTSSYRAMETKCPEWAN